jgi:hypothetical protein
LLLGVVRVVAVAMCVTLVPQGVGCS